MELGRLGVWASMDGMELSEAREAAARIESLGYSALWHPMAMRRDILLACSSLLDATESLIVATGIAVLYEREPLVMASGQRTLQEQSGGRFLLGLGVSHPPIVDALNGPTYGPPLKAMRSYLDRMDRGLDMSQFGGPPVPEGPVVRPDDSPPRVLAALRKGMLGLSRDRADGAHPYFMPPEHTRRAREILGPDKWLCPEVKVVLEAEPGKARELARGAAFPNITMPNYQNAWKELGYDDADFQDGGTDRFIDATVAWGNLSAIEKHLREHFDAGASHVCVQVVHPEGRAAGLHWETLEAVVGLLGN